MLPRLGFLTDKPVALDQGFQKEPGVVYDQENQVYVLPAVSQTGDFLLEGKLDHCTRLLAFLFASANEELWWVSTHKDAIKSFQAVDPSIFEERDLFTKSLHSRAKVSYPFTVLVDGESAGDFLDVLVAERQQTLRFVVIGTRLESASGHLKVRAEHSALIAEGRIADRQVELTVIDGSLTSEPADDPRDERLSTSERLELVSQASRHHGSTRRNESKRFNFPFRRRVIDEAKGSLRSIPTQNQVGQNLSSQMGSANPVTDITARLRDLGHGV